MSLKLMYITNRPAVAKIAENAGVDRIWIDMEYIGKASRQKGMDTVKNHHTVDDIKIIRPCLKKSELLVRINPLHNRTDKYPGTEKEIKEAIRAGADILMLPMFKTAEDVKLFNKLVNHKTKKILLLETLEALENIDSILAIEDLDEIHIGLNDLHLALHKQFMFELLADGTVDKLCEKFKARGIKYGFGGIARIGLGKLPSEYIIAEHYRLGSSMAILSRSFCNANTVNSPIDIQNIFIKGVKDIRTKECEVAGFTEKQLSANHGIVKKLTAKIVEDTQNV